MEGLCNTISDRDINKESKEVMEKEALVTMSAVPSPPFVLPTDLKGHKDTEQCPRPKKNGQERSKKSFVANGLEEFSSFHFTKH